MMAIAISTGLNLLPLRLDGLDQRHVGPCDFCGYHFAAVELYMHGEWLCDVCAWTSVTSIEDRALAVSLALLANYMFDSCKLADHLGDPQSARDVLEFLAQVQAGCDLKWLERTDPPRP